MSVSSEILQYGEKLKRLKEEAESVGLQININKMKGMRVNTFNMQKFRLEEMEIEEVGSLPTKCGVRKRRNRGRCSK